MSSRYTTSVRLGTLESAKQTSRERIEYEERQTRQSAAATAADELITYSRGRITILERKQLEKRSCGCYATITAETERLLGNGSRR